MFFAKIYSTAIFKGPIQAPAHFATCYETGDEHAYRGAGSHSWMVTQHIDVNI